MSNCKGCESGGECEHDIQCLADSYMTFTGAYELPEDIRERVRSAFIAGYEWATGKAVKAVVKVEEEKRCGTCARWNRLEDGHPLGICSCPVPSNLSTSMPTRDALGTDCPCWKAST